MNNMNDYLWNRKNRIESEIINGMRFHTFHLFMNKSNSFCNGLFFISKIEYVELCLQNVHDNIRSLLL